MVWIYILFYTLIYPVPFYKYLWIHCIHVFSHHCAITGVSAFVELHVTGEVSENCLPIQSLQLILPI